ncbi:MAG: hypothetical protein AAF399_29820 [Bacteroidota bacterium]
MLGVSHDRLLDYVDDDFLVQTVESGVIFQVFDQAVKEGVVLAQQQLHRFL